VYWSDKRAGECGGTARHRRVWSVSWSACGLRIAATRMTRPSTNGIISVVTASFHRMFPQAHRGEPVAPG
jgi:hypothetical protein